MSQKQRKAPKTADLEAQIERLQYTLRTFIAWTAQSACAPINRKDAETLFAMLERTDPRPSPGPEAGEVK